MMTKAVPMQPKELTTSEIAERLGITPLAIRGLIKRGHFPNFRKLPGASNPYLVPQSDLDTYLVAREARKLKRKSAAVPEKG
jgi:excisionase family DNA binding protein